MFLMFLYLFLFKVFVNVVKYVNTKPIPNQDRKFYNES